MKRTTRRKKRQALNNELDDIDNNRKNKRIKQHFQGIKKVRKGYQARSSMIKDGMGNLLTEEEKVMIQWQTHFEELLNRPAPINPITMETIYGPEVMVENPTLVEIKEAIKSLKNNKSPGKDTIPAEIWKYGGEILEEKIYNLILSIWKEERIPEMWEEGIIIPLHKKGDRLVCNNYRGISLWPTAYKIFTKIIHQRLTPYSESIIGEYQAGFRRGRSTNDQLFTMRQLTERFWEYDKPLIHLFIDYKQAYDSVHRPSMWHILKEMGIPEKLIRLTKACYIHTKCSVRYGRKLSSQFTIRNGLKQGCILSPLLFNVILEKVARTVTSRREGASFRNLSLNCLGYADDIDIITEDLEDTKQLTTIFKETSERIGLSINVDKTKIMEVARAPQLQGMRNLNGMNVEAVESFKYLGMTLTSDGRMDGEVSARMGAASRCYYSLLNLFKRRAISQTTKLRVYNTVVRPILLYGCEVWGLTKTLEKKLEVFENKILRRITGPVYEPETQRWRMRHNWEIREKNNQPHIGQVIKARRIQWAGHVARMGDERMPKRVFVADMIGRRPMGRPRKDWNRCLREDLSDWGLEAEGWMELAQDRREWKSLSRAVMGHRVAQRPVE